MKQLHYTLGFQPLKSGYVPFVSKPFRIVWRYWGHYINPMTYLRWAGRLLKRGFYGYADNDYWDADSYVESVLLGVIRDLRANTHGYPNSVADYGINDTMPEGAVDTGFARWQAILDEIIEGLEAARELRLEETIPDGIYPTGHEFVPSPDKPGMMTLTSVGTFDREAFNAWEAPLIKKRKRAMLLLCKHWGSFWD